VHCETVTDGLDTVDPWRFKISYDKLIIALGAEALTFGIHGVKEHAIFLREVRHAQEIRRKLLLNLMLSDMPGMQLLFCFCFNIFLGNKFICQVCLFNMKFFFFWCRDRSLRRREEQIVTLCCCRRWSHGS
jgi:hypothetical protein